MVDNGIAPLDAMRFATSAAADLVDLPGEGRIADGACADFLFVNGDPVADIERVAGKKNHRLVVKRGQLVTGAAMAFAASPFQTLAAF